MRTLFICFLLGALAWLIQQGPSPFGEPVSYVGVLIVLPILGARVAARLGAAPYIGALVAGLLIGPMGLLSDWALSGLAPFEDLAIAWVGLYLGAALAPAVLSDRRLLITASSSAVGALLLTSSSLAFLFSTTPREALGLGLIAALGAPIFAHYTRPIRWETFPLSLLTTGLGLAALGLMEVLDWQADLPLPVLLAGLAFWGAGIEAAHQASLRIRTAPGRFLLFAGLALLAVMGSRALHLHVLFLSAITGLALSLRFGTRRRAFGPLSATAELVLPVVVGGFAARLDLFGLLQLSAFQWQFLLVYVVAMVAGKVAGSLLANRSADAPLRNWSPLLLQGILAATLLPMALPAHMGLAGAPSASLQAGLVLLCGIGIPLLLWPIQSLAGRFLRTRYQTASRR